jgi:hypothetical protein
MEETMKRNLLKIGALSLGLACAPHAAAGWSDVTDTNELRALYSDATLNGRAANGDVFYGHFYAGGFGTMIANGAKMRAPWHLNGNSELCIDLQEGAECYRLQRTGDFSTHYRAIRVRDRLAIPLSVQKGVPEF